MAKDFQTKHLKYFFSYVTAAFWERGDLLGGKHFSAQIMHAKRIRLGLCKRAYGYAQERMGTWLQDLGVELRDEQTGKQLLGTSAASMTQASTTPEAWGPCESVFPTNVPPYWKDVVLRHVLTTQGTGQEDFVLDRRRFHVGDIRSKTWMVTGPKVSSLLGKVLQAAQAGLTHRARFQTGVHVSKGCHSLEGWQGRQRWWQGGGQRCKWPGCSGAHGHQRR